MPRKLSQRAHEIPPSPIRKLLPFDLQARERGINVYHLNIGQPDIPTPQEFVDALRGKLPPVLGYGPSQGLQEYREALSEYYGRYDIPFGPDEIIATHGGSEAIYFAFMAIADPGDEIIVFEPFYTNYIGFSIYAGIKLVPYATKAETGFHLPPREEIEALVTDRTRGILICSPNNPTGAVLTRKELEMVADIAIEHDLYVVSDEVYREFAYDGEVPTSIMAIERVRDRAIVVDSISKRYSACGARIGSFATKNREIYDAVLRFAQARLCPSTAEQLGAVAAYHLPNSYFEEMQAEYQARRDAIYEGLMEIPGVVCQRPKGAFYIMAKLPIDDGDRFAKWLLTDFDHEGETVMVAPGAGFYATPGMGRDEIRLAYVLESSKCRRAMEVLGHAVHRYRKDVMGA